MNYRGKYEDMLVTPTLRKVTVLLLMLSTLGCGEQSQEEVEYAIATYPISRQADQLCSSLAVPPQFRFVKKGAFANSETGWISYNYASELKAADVSQFYRDLMTREGWTMFVDEPEMSRQRMFLMFQRKDEIVSISRYGYGEFNYTVSCGIKDTER